MYDIQTRTNFANCKLPENPIFEKISRTGQVSFTMVNSMSMAHSAINFSLVRRMTNIAIMQHLALPFLQLLALYDAYPILSIISCRKLDHSTHDDFVLCSTFCKF